MTSCPANLPISLCLIQLPGAVLAAFATWSSIKSILLTASAAHPLQR